MKINSSIKYNVIVQFNGSDKTIHEDVIYLSIFRCPLIKQAPCYLLRINTTPILSNQIRNEINDNNIPSLNMRIYIIDERNNGKLVTPIYDRNLSIVSVNNVTEENLSRGGSVCIDLILTDPILYDMSARLTYNKIKNSVTAKAVLDDFESFIEKKYGKCFSSTHLISSQNNFIYDQLVVMPSSDKTKLPDGTVVAGDFHNDLDVPTYIQNKYKIDNAFSFYFFDDFNLKGTSTITRFFISLYDYKKFPQFDITAQDDVRSQSQRIKSTPVSDINKIIIKDTPVVNYRLPNMTYETRKQQTSKVNQIASTVKSALQLSSKNRTSNVFQTTQTQKTFGQSGDFINIKTPDSVSSAEKRLEIIKDTFINKIDCIEYFDTTECSYDWLQFGNLYNMSTDNPEQFIYTPVSIINIFRRVGTKGEMLSHHTKYAMVKFKK